MNNLFSQFRTRCSYKFLLYFFIFPLFTIGAGFRNISADWIKDSNENMPVCTAANEQHFPSLTSDGSGGLIVGWRDARNENRDIFAQRVSPTGEMLWGTDGIPVCDLPSAQSWPDVIPDESGGAILVFGDSRARNQDIYAQRISANGELLWDEKGIAVCIHPTLQDDVKAISDGMGGAIVIWEDWRDGNQDIYTQRIDSNGKPVWAVNGIPVHQAAGDQYDPVVVADGTGGAIVVWWDISTSDWDIFAQRVNAAGEIVWADSGVAVCTASGNQGGPFVTADGSGGVFVVWSDYRNDPNILTSADLYAQKIDANGVALWEKDGISICNNPANQQQPEGIGDGAGGLIITWWDERDVFADIYAQRLGPDGKSMWELNGIPVCVAEGQQRQPQLVSDESQGAIIYWLDYREDYGNVTMDAIYAQRIDANGKSLWALNGMPVCTADGDQITPKAISDGRGGAFIVWSDTRQKNHDIYIHQVP